MQTLQISIKNNTYSFIYDVNFLFDTGIILTSSSFGEILIAFSDFDIEGYMKDLFAVEERIIQSSPIVGDSEKIRLKQLEDYYYQCACSIPHKYEWYFSILLLNDLERSIKSFFITGQYSYTDISLHTQDKTIEQTQVEIFTKWGELQTFVAAYFLPNKKIVSKSAINRLSLGQDIKVRFLFDSDSNIPSPTYALIDIYSLLVLDFFNVQTFNTVITKCRNCGRFFIPRVRSDEIYCDRIFQNGKTCKDVGYVRNADEFQKLYRTAYKTQKARCRYHQESNPNYEQQHFIPWNDAALSAKKHFQDSNDLNGFREWLSNNRNAF